MPASKAKVAVLSFGLLLAQAAGFAHTQPKITVIASPTHSTLHFMEALRGAPARSNIFRSFLERKRPNNADDRARLTTYSRLLTHRWNSDVGDRLERLALKCKSIDEFVPQAASVLRLTPPERAGFKLAVTHFDDIFRTLIWNPQLKATTAHKSALIKALEKGRLTDAVDRIAHFLDSKSHAPYKLNVALVPLPIGNWSGKVVYAHPNQDYEVLEFLSNENITQKEGIVLHEFCHLLFDHKSDQVKTLISRFCNGRATDELDEGIAHAVGRWRDQNCGIVSESPHYDPISERFADAIFPMVKRYLDNDLTIDAAFLRQASDKYAATFKNLGSDRSLAFRRITFLAPNESLVRETKASNACADLVCQPWFKQMEFERVRNNAKRGDPKRANPKSTNSVIIARPSDLATLSPLAASHEEVEQLREFCKRGNSFIWCKEKENSWSFFCIGESKDDRDKALGRLIHLKSVSPGLLQFVNTGTGH